MSAHAGGAGVACPSGAAATCPRLTSTGCPVAGRCAGLAGTPRRGAVESGAADHVHQTITTLISAPTGPALHAG
jgi:hypothetical protein